MFVCALPRGIQLMNNFVIVNLPIFFFLNHFIHEVAGTLKDANYNFPETVMIKSLND